jgi:pyridoxamine 5'-phosphate oxidase
MSFDELRRSYERGSLDAGDLDDDPVVQLGRWLHDAVEAGMHESNAMTLATVDEAGRPNARSVLLKGIENGTLLFYTNYESRKGRELAGNPHVALCLWWDRLERQVRVRGHVERAPESVSDAYFATRPYLSQLAAHASDQSRPLATRAELEDRLRSVRERYMEGAVPRPEDWGGFVVIPDEMEFWQGRRSRLHDRLLYTREGEGWSVARLMP